ncbi:MAG TPA: hypothetical protein VE954_32845 [Oligoflexus sp.]|uniref:hypothetical protein n=1 Tax=Oligoflexus sp. TaxID=1971216 RepID=UPI002D699D01|nr:hypothetical protein [Oligoflexus sp.]HYX37915.1 hypothetical protein [Oligoflexus sp.]
MRFIVSLLTGLVLFSCRTTKEEDKRFFAESKGSNDGLQGVAVTPLPKPVPGTPVPTLPEPADPLEKGAFYGMCKAKDQLTSQQALTVKALLAAVHQKDCLAGERWLRDQRNKTVMIESEELVELQTLTLFQNYPHVRDVYIRIAKGVDPVCPLRLPQTCHFSLDEF